ncbi:MAG: hypothetical protein FWJ93_00175 [Micromonosporaceae bacterium]
MTEPLTDYERHTLRDAAYGAIFLVSNADPGLLDMVKESFAASKVLARSPGTLREVLTTGGLPTLPRSPAELEEVVLPALRRSMAILRAKAPGEAENFRTTVFEACTEAAAADSGIKATESTALAKIRSALDSAPQ